MLIKEISRTKLKTCICLDEASRVRLQRTKIHPRRTKIRPRSTKDKGAHIESQGKLILGMLIYLTVNSQDDSHYELAVSFL